LIDLRKGTLNFRAGQFWSGFQSEEVVVRLSFEQATEVEKIYLSLLSDHNSQSLSILHQMNIKI